MQKGGQFGGNHLGDGAKVVQQQEGQMDPKNKGGNLSCWPCVAKTHPFRPFNTNDKTVSGSRPVATAVLVNQKQSSSSREELLTRTGIFWDICGQLRKWVG